MLLLSTAALLILSSWVLGRLPDFPPQQLIPIFLLGMMLISLRGLERSRVLSWGAARLEGGRSPLSKLVGISLFLSTFLGIDATLLTLLPLVIGMKLNHRILAGVLVALSAHVGAALTPVGTPQNLFIFHRYSPGIGEFILLMVPFALGFSFLYLSIAQIYDKKSPPLDPSPPLHSFRPRPARIYGALFLLSVAAALHLLPWWSSGIVVGYGVWRDREALRIDYSLLATFVLFVGLAENISQLIPGSLLRTEHTFLLAAALSQGISNVPATLLLQHFTPHWQALLWGVNAGGFGTPVASMANLITLRIFAKSVSGREYRRFRRLFLLGNILSLLAALILYRIFWGLLHGNGG